MKKLLLATEDYIVVTPELFNDLESVKIESPTEGYYIVKQHSTYYITMFDVEVMIIPYDDWTKYDGLRQKRFLLDAQSGVYEAQERFEASRKEFEKRMLECNTVKRQLEEWK